MCMGLYNVFLVALDVMVSVYFVDACGLKEKMRRIAFLCVRQAVTCECLECQQRIALSVCLQCEVTVGPQTQQAVVWKVSIFFLHTLFFHYFFSSYTSIVISYSEKALVNR